MRDVFFLISLVDITRNLFITSFKTCAKHIADGQLAASDKYSEDMHNLLLTGVLIVGVFSPTLGCFIGHIFGESYHGCAQGCDSLPLCTTAWYYRQLVLCKLYRCDETLMEREPGIRVYVKPAEIRALHNCTEGCPTSGGSYTFCPEPVGHPEAMISGNMRGQGVKIKYSCIDGSDDAVVTCLENGTWSDLDIDCKCQLQVQHANTVLTRVNDSFVESIVTCLPGYGVHGDSFVSYCNVETGEWSNSKMLCQLEWDGMWQYVFGYSKNSLNSALAYWMGQHTNHTVFSDFRNGSVIDKWVDMNITRIKLEVIKSHAVVRHIVFKGEGTDLDTWFNMQNVLTSSWDDLRNGQTGELKYSYTVPQAEFFAYQYFPLFGNCFDDLVWLAVSGADCIYPCDGSAMPEEVRIMYSLGNTSSQFVKVGYGDRFVVWVERFGQK